MQPTEQHVVDRDDPRYKTIEAAAFKSNQQAKRTRSDTYRRKSARKLAR